MSLLLLAKGISIAVTISSTPVPSTTQTKRSQLCKMYIGHRHTWLPSSQSGKTNQSRPNRKVAKKSMWRKNFCASLKMPRTSTARMRRRWSIAIRMKLLNTKLEKTSRSSTGTFQCQHRTQCLGNIYTTSENKTKVTRSLFTQKARVQRLF